MRLDLKSFIDNNVVPMKAYERPGSHVFFGYVKEGNAIMVEEYLDRCKYFVYDFDEVHSTPLHWAAKRGLHEIMAILLNYGANANSTDIVRLLLI